MKRILIFCCCLFVVSGANAQLTLDECRRLAGEHYPAVRQYDLVRLSEEYTLSNAKSAYYPQFAFSAEATWQSAVPAFPDELIQAITQKKYSLTGINKDQYKIALELNQTIWDGGKSMADRRIATAESAEQQRSTDVDMYALQGRVDNLFFGILLLDERIAQTELTIGLLKSNLEKVRSLQRNGVATQADADAVEAELLTVGQQLTQLGTARSSYRRMLGIFIGRELDNEQLVRPEMVEPSSFEPARPELELFDAKSDKLAAQELLVRSSLRPRLGFFAQGYYGYPSMNFIENMMDGEWSWNAMIGVKMSWNFGAYYTKKNSLNLIRTARRQVDVQRDVFLFNTRLQTTEESGEIARLRKVLADDDRIVSLRRQVREAAESKLRNGVIDTNDLLGKITEEANAAMARSGREIELLKTIYELKHTVNR